MPKGLNPSKARRSLTLRPPSSENHLNSERASMPLSQQDDAFSHHSPILSCATAYPLTFSLTYTFFATEE
jgi:hypothetical protein